MKPHHEQRRRIRGGVGIAAAALLVACANTPSGDPPSAGLPAAYASAAGGTGAAGAELKADWWTLYGDATLNGLVDAALTRNTDLALAAARIDESAALVGLARASQWPTVDLGAQATRQRVSTLNNQPIANAEATTHRVALSSSFEIDLWGRLRNTSAAARDQLLAAQYARDAVKLGLAASTAQTYFGIRALDAQLAVLAITLRSREESLGLVQRRAAQGVASPLEEAQAQAAVAATAAQMPELQRQRSLLENQLGVLTGDLGRKVDAAEVALGAAAASTAASSTPTTTTTTVTAAAPLPDAPVPPAGLPSQLLQRRPDVQQAEAQVRAARAQVEVARTAMFPALSLTASLGSQSADLSDLLKSGARIWSLGPSLLLPIFDAGRNAARTDQARAQAEQAAVNYQKAAQTAYRETADGLVNAEQSARQQTEVTKQLTAAREVLRVATRRYEAGYSGYLEVLDAQRGLQDAELALLRSRQARLDASVGLFKALGGGWVAGAR